METLHQKSADSFSALVFTEPSGLWFSGITGRHHRPGFPVYLPETEPKGLSYLHIYVEKLIKWQNRSLSLLYRTE